MMMEHDDVMIMMMDGYFGHRLDNEKAGLQSNSGMCFFFPTLSAVYHHHVPTMFYADQSNKHGGILGS